jgi:murein DD-endopeptidase MepM/ murein hydrolase activator NlpD
MLVDAPAIRSLALAALVAASLGTSGPVASASSAPAPVRRTCSTGAPTVTVVGGDTWSGLAKQVGTPMSKLLAANTATTVTVLHPGDVLCLPDGAVVPPTRRCPHGTHTVARGDTWSGLAKRTSVKMSALLGANGASVDTVLIPGRTLCLPAGATPITSATSTTSTSTRAASRRSITLAASPLQGPCWYADTWLAPRGGGRRHEGVDLIAEPGQYVYAVVDGFLTNRAWDQPGRRAGNAWWLTAADGSGTYFFYAHLSDFAPGLSVGDRVEAGEIIGFLGETGLTAGPHLHFEVHPEGGAAVNPYPIVRASGGCRTGEGYRQPGGWVPT